MQWNVGTKLSVGFGVVLAVFVIVGAVTYGSTRQLIAAADLRQHSYEVLTRRTEVLALLTAIQSGQRGYLLSGDESYLQPYQEALGELDRTLRELRNLTSQEANVQRELDSLDPLVKARLSIARENVELRRAGGLEAVLPSIKSGRGEANMEEIRRILSNIERQEQDLLKRRVEAARLTAERAQRAIVLGTIAALVLAALAGLLITRNIAPPLQNLTAVAERITLGDLKVDIPTDARRDEVGALARTCARMVQSLRLMAAAAEQIAASDLRSTIKLQSDHDVLGHAFTRMSNNLRQQIGELIEGANVLGSAASEIVASTAQLASGASESATAVSETTTTVEEIRQTAQMSSQKAKVVADNAQKTAQISQSGRKSTEEVVAGMARIREQMDAIAASMVRLSEQSQAIGQIIATVEDLAAQSNLLAVNAAIEATKAGEHGKGFGVVAQEVKSLAEQSRQATGQVRTILSDIQKATAAAVMATEQGSKAVETGGKQTEAAGESIQLLSGSVAEATQAATQIAASSQQQLVGMDQVAAAMENIKQASAQNVASAKQLETSARNLDELGRKLKQMVERYKM